MSEAGTKNEIVVYQPNGSVRLEVDLHDESIWLTQQKIADLFGVQKAAISKHLKNIFATKELREDQVVSKMETTTSHGALVGKTQTHLVRFYNLDAIIAVGYRVNSVLATQFRIWATKVLKEYLLRGYAVNERLNQLEDKVDRRLAKTERDVIELKEQVGFFVKTALPPVEGVLFEGQIKDAYDVALKIVRSARKSLVLIDNWIDDTVLTMLDKRGAGVACTVYTKHYSKRLALDVRRHNEQYAPIAVKPYRGAHDRFLIADSAVYHVGASLKDLGKSLFAFSRLVTPASAILAQVEKDGAKPSETGIDFHHGENRRN